MAVYRVAVRPLAVGAGAGVVRRGHCRAVPLRAAGALVAARLVRSRRRAACCHRSARAGFRHRRIASNIQRRSRVSAGGACACHAARVSLRHRHAVAYRRGYADISARLRRAACVAIRLQEPIAQQIGRQARLGIAAALVIHRTA